MDIHLLLEVIIVLAVLYVIILFVKKL